LNIRTATTEDFAALDALKWRSSMVNERDRDWMLANKELAGFEGIGLAEGHIRVAEDGDQMIGFATALPEDGYLELEDLFVDPDWMRRGVATALIADICTRGDALGVDRIEVTANDHALAFYEAAGFVQVGIVETGFRPGLRMHLDIG
jgi:ribosomal protein S18 acetylase RimI-like enzyme